MGKFVADPDDNEDLDTLIDRAVDTFFVEAPSEEELSKQVTPAPKDPPKSSLPDFGGDSGGPSLDEAVNTLFMTSFDEDKPPTSGVSSGDPETDRAIDLAVDTLFVEEPETAPPETAELEVRIAEPIEGTDAMPEPRLVQKSERKRSPVKPLPRRIKKPEPPPEPSFSYDDAMAQEIERHMHTLFEESNAAKPAPVAPAQQSMPQVPEQRSPTASPESPFRKLQEAILTLEWEISKRSVSVLANELNRVRIKYKDNVTVDFAALSMRVVLEYVVKRMSKAHPESIRFLLEVADFLDNKSVSSDHDPLQAFHYILSRYEQYKSTVRKAEGLPDSAPPVLNQLQIKDPGTFAKVVESQAKTIMKAGYSLAKRLSRAKDPETLIRSFRFLVSRSVNRVMESTQKEVASKALKNKQTRRSGRKK